MPALVQVLVGLAVMTGFGLLAAAARFVSELASNVRETTPVVRGLVGDVADIKAQAARDRERLAAVEAALWWPHEYAGSRWRERT